QLGTEEADLLADQDLGVVDDLLDQGGQIGFRVVRGMIRHLRARVRRGWTGRDRPGAGPHRAFLGLAFLVLAFLGLVARSDRAAALGVLVPGFKISVAGSRASLAFLTTRLTVFFTAFASATNASPTGSRTCSASPI